MEHVIGFPGLGLEFSVNRAAFSLFGVSIYWYGLIICAGFIVAALYISRHVASYTISQDDFLNCLLLGVPSGIIGARVYYVIFKWSEFQNDLLGIFNTRRGGLAIYGGIIGAVLALYIYTRVKKLSYASVCDLAAMGIIIGQCIGRWGNFVNAEAHGGVTTLPWGMTIDGALPVHPTFFYESLWNLIGFVMIHLYAKKRKFNGEVALIYVVWYGLGRVWIEGLRSDSLYIGSMRVSQLLAGLSCIAAIAAIVIIRNHIKVEKAFYAPPTKQTQAEETSETASKEETT